MPAMTDGVVSTLYDISGNPVFVIYQFYTEATGALRDGTQITSRGNRTGAIVVDNMTGRSQAITTTNQATGEKTTYNISPNGAALTVAQLAAQTPPVTTIADLSGMSPSVTL